MQKAEAEAVLNELANNCSSCGLQAQFSWLTSADGIVVCEHSAVSKASFPVVYMLALALENALDHACGMLE
jgi:hypothetical protein